MTQTAGARAVPKAALAGVPAGVQALGAWQGRRQLFIRFAAEAETATMYSADALASELKRIATRSPFHSIAISGRDPLANADYLAAVLERELPLPAMLDNDGQRPDALQGIVARLSLMQLVMDGSETGVACENAMESLRIAGSASVPHALVLAAGEQATDAQLLRIVEQGHAASSEVQVIIHPPANAAVDKDRRWITLMERAAGVHTDVRLALRIPGPTGMR